MMTFMFTAGALLGISLGVLVGWWIGERIPKNKENKS